jgi:pyrroloquinoline quinone (PQQ) biosynthesis protein C
MSAKSVIQGLDAVVDKYCKRNRFQNEEMTLGRAQMFVRQHRLNTRQRNSVLKLRVATNTPDWDTKIRIIKACSQEIVADDEFGHGRPHWEIIEDLGVALGLKRDEIRATRPLPTTEVAWAAWEGLMSNKHWLEGIIANACAERANVPGYGLGENRDHGNSWLQRKNWKRLFNLTDEQLEFWAVHAVADIDHSNLAWEAIAENAEKLQMEDAVIHACDVNLKVWEIYWHGICDAGDGLAA